MYLYFQGTNQKDSPCQTCGKNLNGCVGHFGYLDLELPVFHVGYFRSIIMILQSICKRCAHVLLDDNDKEQFRRRLTNPDLSYMIKKSIRKKITEKCKKINKCRNCNDINGVVKKMTASKTGVGGSVLKIIHEKFRGKSDSVIKEHMGKKINYVRCLKLCEKSF